MKLSVVNDTSACYCAAAFCLIDFCIALHNCSNARVRHGVTCRYSYVSISDANLKNGRIVEFGAGLQNIRLNIWGP